MSPFLFHYEEQFYIRNVCIYAQDEKHASILTLYLYTACVCVKPKSVLHLVSAFIPSCSNFNSWSRLIVNNMHSPLICKVLQKGKELFSGSEWENVQQQSSQIQTFSGISVRQPVSYSTGKLIRMLCTWKGEQLPPITNDHWFCCWGTIKTAGISFYSKTYSMTLEMFPHQLF